MPRDYTEEEVTQKAVAAGLEVESTVLSDAVAENMQSEIDAADTTQLQEAQAVNALQQIEAIQPEAWQELDQPPERLDALQQVENQMADIQGRPSAEVTAFNGRPGDMGYYDRVNNTIHINEQSLMGDNTREAVDTTVHEGRHAYQQYAIDHPGFHDDPMQVEAWRDNMDFYKELQVYGEEEYRNQPVEADAWTYSQRIADGVYRN